MLYGHARFRAFVARSSWHGRLARGRGPRGVGRYAGQIYMERSELLFSAEERALRFGRFGRSTIRHGGVPPLHWRDASATGAHDRAQLVRCGGLGATAKE